MDRYHARMLNEHALRLAARVAARLGEGPTDEERGETLRALLPVVTDGLKGYAAQWEREEQRLRPHRNARA